MKFHKFLPKPPNVKVSDWQEEWLAEVCPETYKILPTDDLNAMRERSEKLSSYIPTLTILIFCNKQYVDKLKYEFAEANPPPQSGITAWNKLEANYTRNARRDLEFLEALHHDIEDKLNKSQTNMNIKASEVRKGLSN